MSNINEGLRSRGLVRQSRAAALRSTLFVVMSISGLFFAPAELIAQVSARSEAKARPLLGQMTLEEKVGQMVQADMTAVKDKADIQRFGFGSMLSGGDSEPADITAKGWLDTCTDYQSWAL